MAAQELTDEQLEPILMTILEDWPLYRELEYSGAYRVATVPEHVKLWCDNCNLDSFWRTAFYEGERNKNGFSSKEYRCRNCGHGPVRFYFRWESRGTSSIFCKVGQYPPLEEQVTESLRAVLDGDDLKLYKNALRMRNFDLGIAAVAYLRRVVENRMNDMLDILHQAAIVHNADRALLARLEEVKKDKRFSTKVDYAGDLLPANLRPAGKPNPLAILHSLASAGVHQGADKDCVDVFDSCRSTFDYVFSRIRIELEEARKYVEGMETLIRKKAEKEKQEE